MRIIFWGNGNRGVQCLKTLLDKKYNIELAVVHHHGGKQWYASVAECAAENGISTIDPENPNDRAVENVLKSHASDLFILAGYGMIIRQNIISIPKVMCINLHGGKLPQYRGSSPMNWALINGETSFTLSIIKVDAGVDTGDIVLERTFDISINDTIRDLHRIANEHFPDMLIETLTRLEDSSYQLRPQDKKHGSYYPRRFPDDGLILWDMYTAGQVHNHIRALTTPYPCAFSFYKGRKVKLLSSELSDTRYYGEPGRLYMKSKRGLLICARDQCLWLRKAVFEDSEESLFGVIERYEKLSTLREAVLIHHNPQV